MFVQHVQQTAPAAERASKSAQVTLANAASLTGDPQMATLVEASPLSVYKWESVKVTPRAAQLDRIQAVMKMGKRAVANRLAA